MNQPTGIINCRGLSAALTVLRIKQAVIGRRDNGLPLDVLVDQTCCDGSRVRDCLAGEMSGVRLLYVTDEVAAALPIALTKPAEARHV